MNILNINVIDVVIVLFILCGGVVGMKRGVFKELVMTVGYLLLIIISFVLKNPLAEFLSLHLPFFNFGGSFEGLEVLNILLYQLLSFIIVFAVLSIIFNIILAITKVFEKILNFTIILGMASKLLGLIVGLIEGYILVFFLCIVLSYPIFNQSVVAESTLKNKIVNGTPILSDISKGMTETIDEVIELSKTDVHKDQEEFNRQTVDIMLKHDFVSPEYIEKLIDNEKIKTPGMMDVVNQYK